VSSARPVADSPAARFITTIRWADLPEAVTRRAALCLVDTVAAMLAGRAAPSARIAADLAGAWWGPGHAHLVLDGRRVAAPGAGFANAVAANAVDIDDVGIYTWGHPGAQVVPAALALAEQRHLDGRGLLTAIVVGYEMAFRAGRCVNFEASKVAAAQRTYRACGSWGSVACAAIASHVLGLDETATRHALGIAEYHSPDLPLMRDLDAPAMVKHGVGPGVVTGLLAAELASRGFTGITASLDTERFRDFAGDLGTGYLLPEGISWKRFSSCAWTHPALIAAESLMARHAIAPDRIANVLIETYPDAVRLGTRLPATTEEAQFNLAWPVAALLADGQVGPAQVLGGRLGSGVITELARRIEVRVSSELTRLYYLSEVNDPDGKDAAIVTITFRDGTVLSSGLTENVLYPEPGWGEAEMGEKFKWLAAGHVKAAAINDLLSRLLDVASVPDVSALMDDFASSLLPALRGGERWATQRRSDRRRSRGGSCSPARWRRPSAGWPAAAVPRRPAAAAAAVRRHPPGPLAPRPPVPPARAARAARRWPGSR
jgi:2-methylcitrate dehydratase PrpD